MLIFSLSQQTFGGGDRRSYELGGLNNFAAQLQRQFERAGSIDVLNNAIFAIQEVILKTV